LPCLSKDYDKAVEELQKKYEETTNTFNAEVDAVRAETHFKWVQQVLSESDDKKEASAVGDEL
jgi:cupin superfamily acireductone dioxygenase involved in methionine salvage